MRLTAISTTAIFATAVLAQVNPVPTQTSDDWAAIVIAAPPAGATFTQVQANFVVPSAAPDIDLSLDSSVSAWVGIDGFTNMGPPVIQAGVDLVLEDGDLAYHAWVEWIPALPINISPGDFDILEGDTVAINLVLTSSTTASATFTNGGDTFTMAFSDTSNKPATGTNMIWAIERLQDETDDQAPPSGQLLNFQLFTMNGCMGSTDLAAGGITPDSANGVAVQMLNGDGGIAATPLADGTTITFVWQTG